MEVTESVPRAALDTLSSQVAVLDDEGTILFTNSAWGRVDGDRPDETPDMAGVNYFDSVDPDADEYAVEAVKGIRAVLDGREDQFSFEYPCHTEECQQWFMMRATPFSIGADDFVTVTHIDITDRRLAELEAQEHAERADRERRQLEHLLSRINGLVRDITELLVEAVRREEVEAGVCERVVDADPYVFAWVGDADLSADTLSPHQSAGSVDVDLDSVSCSLSDDTGDPTVAAYRSEEVQVVQHVDTGTRLGDVYGAAGIEAVVAIPLVSRETTYGVLTICADQPDAFDEREQAVLEALGRAIANALSALESRQTLTADRIVEMEFTVDDGSLLPNRLVEAFDCRLSYSGSVYSEDGDLQVFYRVEGVDPEALVETVGDWVQQVRLLAEYDDECLIQLTVESSLVDELTDRGAVTQELTAGDGPARYTVELPQEADAKALFEYVDSTYEGTDLVGYHEHERPVQTRKEFRGTIEDRLTDRQLTALRTAYYSGFFDWPRGVDGDELAEMMDISRSTFHQHLRVAERKVLEGFFEHA